MFRRCPQLFHRHQSGLLPHAEPKAYLIENATRYLILKGREAFDAKYVIGGDRPINPKTGKPFGTETKAYAEWRATVEQEILTEEEGLDIINMAASVHAHDAAADLLSGGEAFKHIEGEVHGLPATALIHWISSSGEIVEIDVINDIDRFEQQAIDGDYAHRLEFQERLLRGCENSAGFYLIAVERKEPYRCGVWEIGLHSVADAYGDNRDACECIKDSLNSNNWPTFYESVRII